MYTPAQNPRGLARISFIAPRSCCSSNDGRIIARDRTGENASFPRRCAFVWPQSRLAGTVLRLAGRDNAMTAHTIQALQTFGPEHCKEVTLDEARQMCHRLTNRRYENFSVLN